MDEKHREYKPIILCSPGIGRDYVNTKEFKRNAFNEGETKEYYRTPSGHKIALPKYWRNKRYSEEEREALWLHKLNQETRYVNGIPIDVSKDLKQYYNVLKQARRLNAELGYGKDKKNWELKIYENEQRKLMQATRIEKGKNKKNNKKKQ